MMETYIQKNTEVSQLERLSTSQTWKDLSIKIMTATNYSPLNKGEIQESTRIYMSKCRRSIFRS